MTVLFPLEVSEGLGERQVFPLEHVGVGRHFILPQKGDWLRPPEVRLRTPHKYARFRGSPRHFPVYGRQECEARSRALARTLANRDLRGNLEASDDGEPS